MGLACSHSAHRFNTHTEPLDFVRVLAPSEKEQRGGKDWN